MNFGTRKKYKNSYSALKHSKNVSLKDKLKKNIREFRSEKDSALKNGEYFNLENFEKF